MPDEPAVLIDHSELSLESKKVIWAYEMGYRVNEEGVVITPSGKTRVTHTDSGRKYLTFSVKFEGFNSARRVYVHRLVAYQKFGDRLFQPGIETRHLNGDGKDNKPDNISIGTHSDNMMDVDPAERKKKAAHASSFIRRHTPEQLEGIFHDYFVEGFNYPDLAAKYGGRDKNYSRIIKQADFSQHLREKYAEQFQERFPTPEQIAEKEAQRQREMKEHKARWKKEAEEQEAKHKAMMERSINNLNSMAAEHVIPIFFFWQHRVFKINGETLNELLMGLQARKENRLDGGRRNYRQPIIVKGKEGFFRAEKCYLIEPDELHDQWKDQRLPAVACEYGVYEIQ